MHPASPAYPGPCSPPPTLAPHQRRSAQSQWAPGRQHRTLTQTHKPGLPGSLSANGLFARRNERLEHIALSRLVSSRLARWSTSPSSTHTHGLCTHVTSLAHPLLSLCHVPTAHWPVGTRATAIATTCTHASTCLCALSRGLKRRFSYIVPRCTGAATPTSWWSMGRWSATNTREAGAQCTSPRDHTAH